MEIPTLVATLSDAHYPTYRLRWNSKIYQLELKRVVRTFDPVNPDYSRTMIKEIDKLEKKGHRSSSFKIAVALDKVLSVSNEAIVVTFTLPNLIFPLNGKITMSLEPRTQDKNGALAVSLECCLTKID